MDSLLVVQYLKTTKHVQVQVQNMDLGWSMDPLFSLPLGLHL